MIIRVYRCTVAEGKDAEFRRYAFDKRHPWLREQAGLVAFFAGKPLQGDTGRSRCITQIWESEEALRAAMGETWRDVPILPVEARSLIESASVEHYELADHFVGEVFQDLWSI
ncbi:MAG: antibiotic biosynthesis monooxygenase [Hyphomicrobiales bacterium]|nr:antibiotic biosynthesis monooxygenase [Hyphomicrobiales bacterium]